MTHLPDPSDPVAAIRAAVAAIPRGRVAAYGEVAAHAGLPGRARLVGKVLRDAPPSARLPWHRVLRSDGRPAFPPGSEPYDLQVRKLAREGVPLVGGRVPARCFAWREEDLDAALWGPR